MIQMRDLCDSNSVNPKSNNPMQEELSMEDLLELETLEIRGGRDGSGGTIGQDKCMNNSRGFGTGSVPQSGCSNNVEGCSETHY